MNKRIFQLPLLLLLLLATACSSSDELTSSESVTVSRIDASMTSAYTRAVANGKTAFEAGDVLHLLVNGTENYTATCQVDGSWALSTSFVYTAITEVEMMYDGKTTAYTDAEAYIAARISVENDPSKEYLLEAGNETGGGITIAGSMLTAQMRHAKACVTVAVKVDEGTVESVIALYHPTASATEYATAKLTAADAGQYVGYLPAGAVLTDFGVSLTNSYQTGAQLTTAVTLTANTPYAYSVALIEGAMTVSAEGSIAWNEVEVPENTVWKTIDLTTAGTLSTYLQYTSTTDNNRAAYPNLKITGPLNANDISLLQKFSNSNISLLNIDLSETTGITTLPGSGSSNNSLFNNCLNLKTVKLPVTITTLGSYQFMNCSQLTSIEGLENVTIVDGYGQNIFYNCSSLKEVNLPSMQCIGTSAFQKCPALEKLYLTSGVYSTSGNMVGFNHTYIFNNFTPTNCTLYLNANQIDKIDATAGTWTPMSTAISIKIFQKVYCGEVLVYPAQ